MNTVKASYANPNVKPPTRDKTLGIETAIQLYEMEECDKTE